MRLDQEREPILGEPLDHPELPERFPAVELLRHDPRRQRLQLSVVARPRQRGVPHVVAQVEVVVVDPDGLVEDGDPAEALPVAWNQVQPAGDLRANALDVDAAGRGPKRAGLEDDEAPEVHVGGRILEVEERSILRRDPLVELLHGGRMSHLDAAL